MIKKENKEKIKNWRAKLKELERVDLPRAKLRAGMVLHKNSFTLEDLQEIEDDVEEITKEVLAIKKVIRKLKREK